MVNASSPTTTTRHFDHKPKRKKKQKKEILSSFMFMQSHEPAALLDICISTEDWPSSKAHQLPLDHHNIAKNSGNFAQMSIFLEIIKVQSEVAFAK